MRRGSYGRAFQIQQGGDGQFQMPAGRLNNFNRFPDTELVTLFNQCQMAFWKKGADHPDNRCFADHGIFEEDLGVTRRRRKIKARVERAVYRFPQIPEPDRVRLIVIRIRPIAVQSFAVGFDGCSHVKGAFGPAFDF
jgi:hypothetical protein